MNDSKRKNINNIFSVYQQKLESLPSHLSDIYYEFEIRFMEKMIDALVYDRIFKSLKKHGFNVEKSEYLLRIQPKMDSKQLPRVELGNLSKIQEYCLSEKYPSSAKCVMKQSLLPDRKPVYNNEYMFRMSVQEERTLHRDNNGVRALQDNWIKLKKGFRYLYRTTLTHELFPHIEIHMSMVRSTKDNADSTYFSKSNVLNQPQHFEVEVECANINQDNIKKIAKEELLLNLKKVIKYILGGVQNTPFPVPFPQLKSIYHEYNDLCKSINNIRESKVPIDPYFIGPSSVTLQKENLITLKDVPNHVCIETGFCVTDKADGDRKLLYINKDKKAYFIDSNLRVSYTGVTFKEISVANTLIDGEHITKDKYNTSIDLFAAFDIYSFNGKDTRQHPFIEDRKFKQDEGKIQSRYEILQHCIHQLNDKEFATYDGSSHHLQIRFKEFIGSYNIFDSCKTILSILKTYDYETDGLIISPKYDEVPRNLRKYTWNKSFKWKPAEFNTIDFLMRVKKTNQGEKEVKTKEYKGQLVEYYEVELYTGYNDTTHMTMQEKLLYDKWQRYHNSKNKMYPKRFEPTNPSQKDAHLCHIHLRKDRNDNYVMHSIEKDIIEDDSVVEFRYVKNDDDKYENWQPLRLRYDKTSAYKTKKSNYGNAFHVANNNWHSIHDPVTEDMIQGIYRIKPEDIDLDDDTYYNNGQKKSATTALRKFHNQYVKKILIEVVTKQGDDLIDLAVGKAGDLPKWISNKLHGVLGIDIFNDNINNSANGACKRYIQSLEKNKNIPICMFVQGDTSKLIETGEFAEGLDTRSHHIVKALMGSSNHDKSSYQEAFLRNNANMFRKKFDVCSIQFAFHYMFENRESLHYFLSNVSKYTKVGGYFIGTCYDGKKIFEYLKKTKKNEKRFLEKDGSIIWHIGKKYDESKMEDDSSCLGMKISVYQESINREFDEYLVNFDYLKKIMNDYGFALATDVKIPAIDNFGSLYDNMMQEKGTVYQEAKTMSPEEKEISFFNNYFIFKKQQDIVRSIYDRKDFERLDLSIGVPEKLDETIVLN